jgi:hypothetical protein
MPGAEEWVKLSSFLNPALVGGEWSCSDDVRGSEADALCIINLATGLRCCYCLNPVEGDPAPSNMGYSGDGTDT